MEQTFNKTIDLIYTAKQAGVELFLNGEKLQLKHAENKTIAKDLLEEIRNNKSVIIDFLKNESFKSKTVNQTSSLVTPFNRDVITNVPLSFAQERLWFIDKLEGSLQYHTLVALRLKGKLSKGALEAAVKSVIKRHEILRTVYIEFDGIGYQKVKDPFSWSMSYLDGSALRDNKTLLDETIHNINKQPFDLSKDFMLRGTVVNIADEDHLLVVSIHHIACDAGRHGAGRHGARPGCGKARQGVASGNPPDADALRSDGAISPVAQVQDYGPRPGMAQRHARRGRSPHGRRRVASARWCLAVEAAR